MEKLEILLDKNGEVYFNNTSLFLWRRGAIGTIQRAYEDVIGPATRVVFTEATREIMREMFVRLMEKYKPLKDKNPSEFIFKVLGEFPKYGYGVPEVVFLDDRMMTAKIRIRNCFNTMGYKNRDRPVCYRMEGILASLFETVFGRKVSCRETKCAAMGEECCEFEMTTYNIPVKLSLHYPNPPKDLTPVEMEFNPEKGEIDFAGINIVFFPRGDAKMLEQKSESIIGPATREIFYTIGKSAGRQDLGEDMLSSLALKIMSRLFKKKFIKRLSEYGKQAGFGIIDWEIMDFRKKESVMKVYNCANAVGVKKSNKPVCYTLLGLFTGACDAIFGKVMWGEEVKCKAMGDPYCEFHMHPESE